MDIEIITTKKKLTKSMVNQMRIASDNVIGKGNVLGYIINARRDILKAVLLEYKKEYFIFSSAWSKGQVAVYRKIGKWSQTKKFNSESECDLWWSDYQEMLAKSTEQIYI